jgi:hypothetical protein
MLDPSSVFEESEHEDYLLQMHNRVLHDNLNLNARET